MVVRGSDYYVGGMVTYHCYSGYELQGNSTATCLLSGRWDSEPPSCQSKLTRFYGFLWSEILVTIYCYSSNLAVLDPV